MCPSCNGDLPTQANGPAIPSSVNGTSAAPQTNGVNGSHGPNDEKEDHTPHQPNKSPMYLVRKYRSQPSGQWAYGWLDLARLPLQGFKLQHYREYGAPHLPIRKQTAKTFILTGTLREGEQFANAFFDTETKIKIAKVGLGHQESVIALA